MKSRFNVSYEIVTPESAEEGDAAERGVICKGATLRDALADVFATRTSRVDGGDGAQDNNAGCGESFTVYNGMEYETGAHESRTFHAPSTITRASWSRIKSIVGVR